MMTNSSKNRSDSFRIGLIQHPCGQAKAENLEKASRLIKEASAQGAQVICLQEIFSTPYFCTVEDAERFDLAETVDGETVCLLYTSPSPRDKRQSRMPSSA